MFLMASFRWQVRHPGDFCHQHILPSLPGHTSTVDISSGDEKKACVSFPDSAVFPTRWVDLKGQPGEVSERLAYFQRSRVVVTGHGKTGVWKAWPSGVLLALSWFSLLGGEVALVKVWSCILLVASPTSPHVAGPVLARGEGCARRMSVCIF